MIFYGPSPRVIVGMIGCIRISTAAKKQNIFYKTKVALLCQRRGFLKVRLKQCQIKLLCLFYAIFYFPS